MSTQAEIRIMIDAAKTQFDNSVTAAVAKQTRFYHFFLIYLLDKYPPAGGEWQPFSAAILTNNLFKKFPEITADTANLFTENEAAITEVLAVFATHFTDLFTRYINTADGNLIPTAALFGAYTIGDDGDFNQDFNFDFLN